MNVVCTCCESSEKSLPPHALDTFYHYTDQRNGPNLLRQVHNCTAVPVASGPQLGCAVPAHEHDASAVIRKSFLESFDPSTVLDQHLIGVPFDQIQKQEQYCSQFATILLFVASSTKCPSSLNVLSTDDSVG